jgi:hypothetical protein
MTTARERKLENLLAKFLEPIEDVPLEIFIKSWFKKELYPFKEKDNKDVLKKLIEVFRSVCKSTIKTQIASDRPNEAGNKIEPLVIQKCNEHDVNALNPKGSGYPDVKINYKNLVIYLEIKTYNKKSINQSLRSFYLSPTKKPKIDTDGFHLIVGFEMEKKGKSYEACAFRIIDGYGLNCKIKFEVQTNNKVMYSEKKHLYYEKIHK